MDLYSQFQKSLKEPFSLQSVYVLFTFLFIVFLSGIILLFVFGKVSLQLDKHTNCNKTLTKNFAGNLSNSQERAYQLAYSGNKNCFLNSFVTWENSDQAISLWVYSPSGNVQIVNPGEGQTHTYFYQSSPLETGTWRLVLKTTSTKGLDYSAQLSVN